MNQELHVNARACGACGDCVAACPHGLLSLEGGTIFIRTNNEECVGCSACVDACEVEAISFSEVNSCPEISCNDFGDSALWEKIKNIIVEQVGVNECQVVPQAVLIDDLGADLLDCVELMMSIEEEFGLVIPEGDAEEWRTVMDILTYVKVHTSCG